MAKETSAESKQLIIDGISTSVDLMDKVVKDVTAILNFKRNSLEEKHWVEFDSIYQSVSESLQSMIDAKTASIDIDFSQCKSCFSIESYLKSIFSHLIENAIKFSKPDQQPHVHIWSEIKENTIQIHFKDNGMGIDMAKHETAIFGLYKQFTKNIHGRGLGLFLVKSQVEFLGGNIKVDSQLNEWTEFIVSLPFQPNEHP